MSPETTRISGSAAVAAVDEAITVSPMDSRRTERGVEQVIDLVAKFGLDGIGTVGRLFDVERDDSSMMW